MKTATKLIKQAKENPEVPPFDALMNESVEAIVEDALKEVNVLTNNDMMLFEVRKDHLREAINAGKSPEELLELLEDIKQKISTTTPETNEVIDGEVTEEGPDDDKTK